MKVDRNATQEQTERVILPAGTYKFKCESALHKTSKSGTPMWELQFSFPDHPDARWCYEYFVENEKNLWKFNQWFDSIGSDDDDTEAMKYAYGEEGQCQIVIESDPNYGDRNRIKRFLPYKKDDTPAPEPAKPARKPRKPSTPAADQSGDDLPF